MKNENCDEPPNSVSETLWVQGINLFNEGEFFECHEVLEDLWNLQGEPEKQLTQGVLQIAVAYLHLGRGNKIGALKLLRRGLPRLKAFRPTAAGIQVEELYCRVQCSLDALEASNDAIPGAPGISFVSKGNDTIEPV